MSDHAKTARILRNLQTLKKLNLRRSMVRKYDMRKVCAGCGLIMKELDHQQLCDACTDVMFSCLACGKVSQRAFNEDELCHKCAEIVTDEPLDDDEYMNCPRCKGLFPKACVPHLCGRCQNVQDFASGKHPRGVMLDE
jgi:hypothetical protein